MLEKDPLTSKCKFQNQGQEGLFLVGESSFTEDSTEVQKV